MKNRVVIGGRYQYAPSQVTRQTDIYTQYKAYDKATKRDLQLQIHQTHDSYTQKLRDIKHAFLQSVFDIVHLQQQGQVAFLFDAGYQTNLQEVLKNSGFIKQSDAMFILKFCVIALKELHQKMIVCNRVCTNNVTFCTNSIIKLGFVKYAQDMPIQFKSPELLRNEKTSYASDIFSLGVILYQMLYGIYPFQGQDQSKLLKQIKAKRMSKPHTSSPFQIIISKQAQFLLNSMLDFYPQNRPTIQSILDTSLMSFHLDTQIQQYIKPKGSIIPEAFIKRYLIFRASKLVYRIQEYYQQNCYLALSLDQKKKFVSFYSPDLKMYEADGRKIQSYFEKLRAFKDSYLQANCNFVCKVQDYQRFRRQPVIITQYCNQGDLYQYMEKMAKNGKWLSGDEINILMYLMAIGYKQMRDIGVTSIHTVHSQRIMIKNHNIKIRQPSLLTPYLQMKLRGSSKIDYFAPQLKFNSDFAQLDKSDMWSYGILFYYMLSKRLPYIKQQQGQQSFSGIDIESLNTNRKNKNLIAKCLNQNVKQRIMLQKVKIEGVNEALLQQMLEQKRQQQQVSNSDSQQNDVNRQNNKHVVFKSRKKKWCKHYNKIIAHSHTSSCRIWMKIIFAFILLWVVFFGPFFVNGGIGLLRTNYYRPIPITVPYNYATSLYNMTILSTDGHNIQSQYSQHSYEQFTVDLRCMQNNRSINVNATTTVDSYINDSGHSVQCFFGFVYIVLICIIYGISAHKLDMPAVILERKQKQKNNKNLYLMVLMYFILAAMLFCFFYIFAFEYQIQMYPCLGFENLAYPYFTSIETLLTGHVGDYFARVFTTVILWSIIMIVFSFVGLLVRKVNNRLFQIKVLVPTLLIFVIETVICRVGFGSSVPLEPTWSYNLNTDITLQYWGFFGFFPQAFVLIIFVMERLVDLLFWFFLRLGMEPDQEQDINRVQITMKLQPNDTYEKEKSKQISKINLMDNQFEIFD